MRVVLLVVLAACLVGLIVWARGPEHHHGRYVGSLGAANVVMVSPEDA